MYSDSTATKQGRDPVFREWLNLEEGKKYNKITFYSVLSNVTTVFNENKTDVSF